MGCVLSEAFLVVYQHSGGRWEDVCGTSHAGSGVAAETLECAHSFLRLLSLGQSTQKIYRYLLTVQGYPK